MATATTPGERNGEALRRCAVDGDSIGMLLAVPDQGSIEFQSLLDGVGPGSDEDFAFSGIRHDIEALAASRSDNDHFVDAFVGGQ